MEHPLPTAPGSTIGATIYASEPPQCAAAASRRRHITLVCASSASPLRSSLRVSSPITMVAPVQPRKRGRPILATAAGFVAGALLVALIGSPGETIAHGYSHRFVPALEQSLGVVPLPLARSQSCSKHF